MVQTVLKPHNLDLVLQKDLVAAPLLIEETENLLLEELIDRSYQEDPLPIRMLQLLANGTNYSKDLMIADCTVINGRLYYRNHFYVPDYHELRLYLC